MIEAPPQSPSYEDVKEMYHQLGFSLGGAAFAVSILVFQLPSRGTTWLDAHVRFVKRNCAIGWGMLASVIAVFGGLAWLKPSTTWFAIIAAIFLFAIAAGALITSRNLKDAARAFQEGRPPPGTDGTPPPSSDDGPTGLPGRYV